MRKAVYLVAIASALGAFVLSFSSRETEPACNGHTLSFWLDWMDSHSKNDEALTAIQQIGTNALPLTLKWLQYEPSPNRERIFQMMITAPAVLQPDWLMNLLSDSKRKDRAADALLVLRVLSRDACPIARDLLALSCDTNRPFAAYGALDALGTLGTNGFPELIQIVKDPKHQYRAKAAWVIGDIISYDQSATSAVPALIQVISDPKPDADLVERASEALSYVPPNAEQLAILSQLATNSDNDIRKVANYRLERFRPAVATNASASLREENLQCDAVR